MRLALALSLAAALAVPASADHCLSWSSTEPHVTVCEVGDCTYVLLATMCSDGGACYPISPWIYEESNGIAGLQREDELQDDTCHGMIAGDTIIF